MFLILLLWLIYFSLKKQIYTKFYYIYRSLSSFLTKMKVKISVVIDTRLGQKKTRTPILVSTKKLFRSLNLLN